MVVVPPLRVIAGALVVGLKTQGGSWDQPFLKCNDLA